MTVIRESNGIRWLTVGPEDSLFSFKLLKKVFKIDSSDLVNLVLWSFTENSTAIYPYVNPLYQFLEPLKLSAPDPSSCCSCISRSYLFMLMVCSDSVWKTIRFNIYILLAPYISAAIDELNEFWFIYVKLSVITILW